MHITALLISRLQFAFTVSFHIIFPSFTIGLAAWLCVLEARFLLTHRLVYRRLFDFWLRIFAIAFGLGVVSGIVMAFEFGTNWSVLSRMSGPIQGPLLSYESFTAFALEASFFGILMFGRERIAPRFYFIATLMVACGTTLSAFWIMVNNTWMQVPVGYQLINGSFVPTDWGKIIFSPVVWVRFPHVLLASYLTGAFCVAATGAWYKLRGIYHEDARAMLRMGLILAAILIPIQLFFGHLNGDYVHQYQPAKFAAIEARWHNEKPAAEVLIGLPDQKEEVNHYQWAIPVLGSLIATMTPDSEEVGLTSFAPRDRPPVAIPFFTFRIMVACGLWMMATAWLGCLLLWRRPQGLPRVLLRLTFITFPLPFIATLTGWFTAEVGRQPWVIYGVLRTSDALTPSLGLGEAVSTLILFCAIYLIIFMAGTYYIYRLLRRGPDTVLDHGGGYGDPQRPLAFVHGGVDGPSIADKGQ